MLSAIIIPMWTLYYCVCIVSSFIVRLVNGSTLYEGRVEVQYNGVWGTICDYGWDLHDAQVVCNQLGFGKSTAALHNAFYGEGIGRTWLYNLNCVGNEESIGNCSHNGWGYYYCSHGDDASVKCSSGMLFSIYANYSYCMYI